MHIIGIIGEYNPFHNGHIYHINKIKEMYPDSLIILVLNGYFLQRGEISTLTKEDKTKIALNHKIDIVVELPFVFGTQSADIFAEQAIHLLNQLNVDTIIFGSESNNVDLLKDIAKKQLKDKEYSQDIQTLLDKGYNYPTAMAKALKIKDFEFKPNDILGICYIKAILKNKYNINIETIQRTNDYKDTKSNNSIISATNIREKLYNNKNISKYVPLDTSTNIIIPDTKKYFELLKFKITTEKDLSIYLDVDEGIEYRLKKYINKANTIDEYIELIKTKRYTYNRLNRMFIHLLIGLTKKDNHNLKLDYLKIQGFNKKGQKYLNSIKKNITLPIKPFKESIIYNYELTSSLIYDLINNTNTYIFEINNKPINKKEIE